MEKTDTQMENKKQLTVENELAEAISNTFHTAKVRVVRPRRIEVILRSDLLPALASNLKYYHEFQHLSLISCVDWIEEKQFELVYFFWSYTHKVMILVKIRLDRDNPRFVTIRPLWRQAQTYEREIHEMFGVHFEGNPNLTPFLLEDWDNMPPMRRDFDTRQYVEETFDWRPGRDEHYVPRLVIAESYHEKIPYFESGGNGKLTKAKEEGDGKK